MCRRCTRRKLQHLKTSKASPEKSQIVSCDMLSQMSDVFWAQCLQFLLKSGMKKDAVHNSFKHSLFKRESINIPRTRK
jgi:hypothetical protein